MRTRRILRNLVEPVAGAAFIGLWFVAEAGRHPDLPVFAALGLAIALSRLLPWAAMGLTLAGLAVGTIGGLLFPDELGSAALESYSWLHQVTATDWPAFVAALAVPALIVGSARTRLVTRASLVLVGISALWLAGILLQATDAIGWTHGRLVEWLPGWIESRDARIFIGLALVFLVVGFIAWIGAWAVAGLLRFGASILQDPLMRVRFNDALRQSGAREVPQLTARERDVLLLVADGKSNAEIAAALFLSETTVKSHLRSILSKMGLKSRTEIAAYAWKTGLVQLV